MHHRYIGDKAFYRRVFGVAVPIIIQNGITNFVSLLDNIMVGRVGTEQMTGVSIVNQLIFVFNLAIFGAVSGAGIFGAQFFGSGDDEGVRCAFRFKLIVCAILTALGAAIFLLFGDDLIRLYLKGEGDPAQIEASFGYAKRYLSIMLFGFVPFVVAQCYSGTLRESNRTVLPMVAGIVGVAVNLVFNTLLIFGHLGFPKLGSAGAAIATVLAQAVSVLLAVALLVRKKLPFAITRADFRLNPQCRKFLSIGLPLALQEFLTQLSFLALCAFVNRLGLTASSGYGVASKIVNFAMLIPSALMQSMASFVAQNVGAGDQKRAKKSMLTGIGVGLFFGCAVFALVMLKGDALAGFFSPDAEVVQKGFEYLKGFAPETILTAILFSMLGYFNGNNKTLWVMAQGLIQTLLVRLPFAYVMSIQPNASLTKIGLAAPVSTLVGVILNVGFYLYLDRKEKRVQRAD